MVNFSGRATQSFRRLKKQIHFRRRNCLTTEKPAAAATRKDVFDDRIRSSQKEACPAESGFQSQAAKKRFDGTGRADTILANKTEWPGWTRAHGLMENAG
jgi:hypothetical protein